VGAAPGPLAPLPGAPGLPDPPDEAPVVPAVPVARAPVPVAAPDPEREAEGVALGTLDVPTETLPPETVTDGALAETVGAVAVDNLVVTVGTGRGTGDFTVAVGVWTVSVGVVIGTVGVVIGTV